MLNTSQPNLKGYETVNQHVMHMPPSVDSGDDDEPGQTALTPNDVKKTRSMRAKKPSVK